MACRPWAADVDDVYAATYATMLERNRRYYRTYPGDRDRVRALHERAEAGRLLLPDGEPVTSWRLRGVGSSLGMSDGADRLHYLLELDPDSPALPARPGGRAALPRPQPAVRRRARGLLRRRWRDPVVRAADAPRGVRRGRHAVHRRARVPLHLRGHRRRWRRCGRRRTCSPSASGRPCTTPRCSARSTCRARRPSTPRTPTCRGQLSEETAAADPDDARRGSPTSTSTTGCVPTAGGSWTGSSGWLAAGSRDPVRVRRRDLGC